MYVFFSEKLQEVVRLLVLIFDLIAVVLWWARDELIGWKNVDRLILLVSVDFSQDFHRCSFLVVPIESTSFDLSILVVGVDFFQDFQRRSFLVVPIGSTSFDLSILVVDVGSLQDFHLERTDRLEQIWESLPFTLTTSRISFSPGGFFLWWFLLNTGSRSHW